MFFDTTSIITVSRYIYKAQDHVRNHCHNFYHLLYIAGGEGILHIQGKEYQTQEHDLYIIAPGVYHEIISNRSLPLFTYEVKFISNDAELIESLAALPLPFHNDNINWKSMLNHLVEEALGKSKYHKQIITLHFLEMLLLLIRTNDAALAREETWQQEFIINEEEYSHELVNEILKYIHRHYTQQITLSELAASFNINLTYICRIFTKKYDISPIQYVNQLKLQKVKELLTSTDRTVTEISEMVGFNSIHYLSRYFTAKEKVTPHEYRKRARNAIHIGVEEKYQIINSMVDLN